VAEREKERDSKSQDEKAQPDKPASPGSSPAKKPPTGPSKSPDGDDKLEGFKRGNGQGPKSPHNKKFT